MRCYIFPLQNVRNCFIIRSALWAFGHMAELVDALVSGTSGATLGSSSLLMPTMKNSFGVVAQLIERYVRIVEVVGLSPISSTKFQVFGDMAEW